MKKLIVALIAVLAVFTLSSFVINKHNSQKTNMNNGYDYYTRATAWSDENESTTIYIYYREGNGTRVYSFTFSAPGESTCPSYYSISKNPLYQSSSCNDFRRKYRYVGYGTYYFNCNLPYMR